MTTSAYRWILYSKPGCHLCEGLAEKLGQIPWLQAQLEIRDITTQATWWDQYQWTIPVLCVITAEGVEQPLPRLSPRATVSQLQDKIVSYVERVSPWQVASDPAAADHG